MDTAEAAAPLAERPDLLLVGGPDPERGPEPRRCAPSSTPCRASLQGVPAASFDTRYRGSTLIMGSAAAEAAKRLGKAGGRLVAPPESFFIARGGPLERQGLEPGELERAEAWGRAVGAPSSKDLDGRSTPDDHVASDRRLPWPRRDRDRRVRGEEPADMGVGHRAR